MNEKWIFHISSPNKPMAMAITELCKCGISTYTLLLINCLFIYLLVLFFSFRGNYSCYLKMLWNSFEYTDIVFLLSEANIFCSVVFNFTKSFHFNITCIWRTGILLVNKYSFNLKDGYYIFSSDYNKMLKIYLLF